MTRVRNKFEMGGEIPGLGLPSHRDFSNSYTIPRCGGLQGTNRFVANCRLPLNCGISSYPKVPVYSSTMPVYKDTTHIPPRIQPYRLTSKNMGKLEGMTNHHPNPSSTSTHKIHVNV
jgi:hypothetical protein